MSATFQAIVECVGIPHTVIVITRCASDVSVATEWAASSTAPSHHCTVNHANSHSDTQMHRHTGSSEGHCLRKGAVERAILESTTGQFNEEVLPFKGLK